MKLKDVVMSVPRTEPVLMIYKYRAVINAKASSLLELHEGDRVKVRFDEEARENGRMRFFIAKSNDHKAGSLALVRRGNTYMIHSSHLVKFLADNMEGYGTYRICPDNIVSIDGMKWYDIFFKKLK